MIGIVAHVPPLAWRREPRKAPGVAGREPSARIENLNDVRKMLASSGRDGTERDSRLSSPKPTPPNRAREKRRGGPLRRRPPTRQAWTGGPPATRMRHPKRLGSRWRGEREGNQIGGPFVGAEDRTKKKKVAKGGRKRSKKERSKKEDGKKKPGRKKPLEGIRPLTAFARVDYVSGALSLASPAASRRASPTASRCPCSIATICPSSTSGRRPTR